jgi:DNA-directed RNA polymerase specialized sigma24 family protein
LKPDDSSRVDAAEFRPTRWSVVLLSAQSNAPGSQAALAALCRLYWYPLYAFVRRRGYYPEDAQDLTQGFFLHLLDHKALAQVDPLKGKFRSFLLASIQNYLSKPVDRMARILIIDDDKSFREALAESCRDFGHDAIEASAPLEAFKLIEDADVAFLDLKMPNMSGIEFLREAKPAVPVNKL